MERGLHGDCGAQRGLRAQPQALGQLPTGEDRAESGVRVSSLRLAAVPYCMRKTGFLLEVGTG